MSYKSRYEKGDWKAVCDSCGRLFKAGSLKRRWDGMMVCSDDWEPRHPQDFVRAKVDVQVPKWTRPEAADVFVWNTSCDLLQSTSLPGYAHPGCLTPSQLLPVWYETVPESTFTL